PEESGGLKIISSTQSPTDVQRIVARILDWSMHQVEVDVVRLGGGFGGKQEQATAWAAMASLAACKLKKPVKIILRRDEDIRITGKRHPYSSDFTIGLTQDGKIMGYEVTFYQNVGAKADLSTIILDKTLFYSTGSYYIPNVTATGMSCRTHLPPNTAMRGFGAPQGNFVIECAIFKAAQKMGVDPFIIQKKNLLSYGDTLIYGMKVKSNQAGTCWECAEKKYDIEKVRCDIKEFNSLNTNKKKGLALMPICFGVSFETTFMNQASALVHIYTDGSVSVSTAAVEMGQGITAKMRQVAARIFSLPLEKIKIESTNTARIANSSPTAASCSADLNGKATQSACLSILDRLKKFSARQLEAATSDHIEIKNEVVMLQGEPTVWKWDELITEAYLHRINLSEHAYYATPDIYFDKKTKKGKPFSYHVFGTAAVEVTLDCLRGTYCIDSVKVAHDFAKSLNPLIDLGQVEGGIVQGLGLLLRLIFIK
ncbi:MAG: xanthine dehydrogenase, partial [Candidatus Electrothrix sp. MAN1_4]|nr:xanthine dehydrogenase [Candidatus Electrothrix sp. MAN1_4]